MKMASLFEKVPSMTSLLYTSCSSISIKYSIKVRLKKIKNYIKNTYLSMFTHINIR